MQYAPTLENIAAAINERKFKATVRAGFVQVLFTKERLEIGYLLNGLEMLFGCKLKVVEKDKNGFKVAIHSNNENSIFKAL